MKLSELIKQLKREYKSGGEVEILSIAITPEGKVIIGGTFESGPTRSIFSGSLEGAAADDLSELANLPKGKSQ